MNALPFFVANPISFAPLPKNGPLGSFGIRFPINTDISAEFTLLSDHLLDVGYSIPDDANGCFLWNGGSPHLIAWNFNPTKTPIGSGLDGYGVIHPYRAQPGTPLYIPNRDGLTRLRLACETVGATTFGMVIFTA